jgi:NAD(P)-dependent dehydrogenase (short-subunit alcohol dehydrogenase family)
MAKRVLITGASSGMGRDMAQFFAARDWQVAATMRNPDRDAAGLNGINSYALDVTDTESIAAAVAQVEADFGGIDVLVNNAGVGNLGPVEGASPAQVQQQADVNLLGPIHMIRAVLPGMRAAGAGTIINITSIGGRITMPHNALYHAMKWGLEGLTEAMAYELNPFGIRMKSVAPGGVKTDFAGRSLTRANSEMDPEYARQNQAFVTRALGRSEGWSEPEVVSKVVWDAATDGTDQIRYLAGADAVAMNEMRQSSTDEAWVQMMKTNFGI